MTTTYPPEEIKPLIVQPLSRGRWKVQSQTDPATFYLVKWWSEEKLFSCDCPFGTHNSNSEKFCKHVREIRAKYSDVCNLCAQKGIYEDSFAAPWDLKVTLFLCDRCDAWLAERYQAK